MLKGSLSHSWAGENLFGFRGKFIQYTYEVGQLQIMISLIRDNCDFLQQGIYLLERHSPDSYMKSDPGTFGSGVGPHMRHVLDHYASFISGVELGIINYDDRERNTLVERSLDACIQKARELLATLHGLAIDGDAPVEVIASANTFGGKADLSESTLARELQFLASHTVHHYALIAIASRLQGIMPDKQFGIAPSTLKYLQTVES